MPGNIPVPPASVIASWPEPNYIDPVRRTWLPPYAIFLHILGSIFVFLRLGLRIKRKGGGLGIDDAFLVPAWLLATGFTAIAVYAAERGLVDRHVWDLRPAELSQDLLVGWIGELFFVLGTACLKISVLLFHWRLTRDTHEKKWAWMIWGGISFILATTVGLFFVLVFNCVPTEAYWKVYDPSWKHEYSCADTHTINPVAAALSIVSDLFAIAVPCVMLWGLAITPGQKILLYTVFCLGLTVVAAACGRTWAFTELGIRYDSTWIGFDVFVWSLLEYELGIICACAPAVRALFNLRTARRHPASISGNRLLSRSTCKGDQEHSRSKWTPRDWMKSRDSDNTLSEPVSPSLQAVSGWPLSTPIYVTNEVSVTACRSQKKYPGQDYEGPSMEMLRPSRAYRSPCAPETSDGEKGFGDLPPCHIKAGPAWI